MFLSRRIVVFVSAAVLLSAVLSSSCGKGDTQAPTPAPSPGPTPSPAPTPAPTASPAPTPSPTPAPTPAPTPTTLANVGGKWSGTLQGANFSRTITLQLFQFADCVDGAWATVPSGWAGAISANTGIDSLFGFMSFEGSADGSGMCTGVGRISGDAGSDTVTWTTSTEGKCPGGIPQTLTLKLRRQ